MSGPTRQHQRHRHGHAKSEDEIDYWQGHRRRRRVAGDLRAVDGVGGAGSCSHETKKVEEATGATHRPPRVEQEEIGIVDQVPFAIDNRLARWRREHDARLNGYGWVDRSKGVAHVPIERAMEVGRRRRAARGGAAMKARRVRSVLTIAAGRRPPRAPRRRRSSFPQGSEQPLAALQDIDVIEHLGDRVPAGSPSPTASDTRSALESLLGTRQAGAGDARLLPLPDALRPGARRPGQGGARVGPQAGQGLLRGRRQHRSRRGRQAARRRRRSGCSRWRAATTRPTGRSGRRSPTAARRPALADAVGFRYKYDEPSKQFAHEAVTFVLTPDGVVSRYLYGVEYPARDFRWRWSRRAAAGSAPRSTRCSSPATGTTRPSGATRRSCWASCGSAPGLVFLALVGCSPSSGVESWS